MKYKHLFYEHPSCTDSDILLFLFLPTNVLVLVTLDTNALNVNVNVVSQIRLQINI